MSQNNSTKKIASVLKAREMQETEALQEKARVQSVLSGRQVELEGMIDTLGRMKGDQEQIRNIARPNLLVTGELYRLPGLLRYDRQLEKKIVQLEKKISEKKEEIAMAESRAKTAQDDLVGARMERKRVEIFISRKVLEHRKTESALGEQEFDDLIGARRKK